MLDLYAMVKAPSIEPEPSGLVDFVWNGPRGQRIVLSLTRKQALRTLQRLARALGEPPYSESDPGEPGVACPS